MRLFAPEGAAPVECVAILLRQVAQGFHSMPSTALIVNSSNIPTAGCGEEPDDQALSPHRNAPVNSVGDPCRPGTVYAPFSS
jgi:hypothetical protein